MAAVTFDTLKFVETLKAAGFDEPQAKGMSAAIREVQDANLSELTTKRDLRELKLEMDARFEKISGELALVRWMLGIQLGGVIALIIKSFF